MSNNDNVVPLDFYRNLGNSGLKISKIIVGCMSYGDKAWADWVLDDEEKIFRIMKKCYDNGIRTFDTANVYSNGKSEEILRKFIEKYKIKRSKIVILSKCYFPVDPYSPDFYSPEREKTPAYEYINLQGLSRKHIFDAVEDSVKRLGTYMDVLQIHRLDKSTPPEEIMKSLNDVVEKGYTRYIGASSMKAYEFANLQFIAEKNHWHKFISMQNYYNLIYREEEREMIPYCNEFNVGLIPWSPNARGLLTRPLSSNSDRTKSDKSMTRLNLDKIENDADVEIIKRVEELSKRKNVSMAAIATAWVINKGQTPIVGINKEERIDDLLIAAKLQLTKEELQYLEEPYAPKAALF
ncbi:hypothetical protein PACTADRAFT_73575 [Pachysolen tannophilus NRRL Y-2460]|uniref:NADP-dependent oxidoreductase domain-containing protein n=1 Tax=Pachysolen tannophilus NRRL Y-2460 TaxID=669874 RepID=A0A1E4U1N3_PACTA|nr:hypothetical protein PACTADRAFT_73575 [Pachysolen tannophilus NRRL Y-2460]